MKLNIINQPFPIHTWRWYRLRGLAYGSFVFLFLLLFKPFYLHLYDFPRLFFTALFYGSITTVVLLGGGYFFVKVLIPRISEEKWTLGKQILYLSFLMICIAWLNGFLTAVIYNVSLPASWYLSMFKWVLMLGVIPVTITETISYNRYLHQHLHNAQQISAIVTEKKTHAVPPLPPGKTVFLQDEHVYITKNETPKIIGEPVSADECDVVLTGENHGDRLALPGDKLLAVQALDNYVNIYWEEQDQLQTTLIRNTLSNIADQLKGIEHIYKTHRGWLVNTKRVLKVEGNAQGLKLQVELLRLQVPVSRANISGYRQVYRKNMERRKPALHGNSQEIYYA